MRYKKLITGVTFLLYFLVDWIFTGKVVKKWLFAIEQSEAVRYSDLLTSDFNSLHRILMIYVIVFMLGLWFCLDKEYGFHILRFKNRNKYLQNEMQIVLIVSAEYSILHELVLFIFFNAYFEQALLRQENFVEYLAVETIVLFLFFLENGIIFLIISELVKIKFLSIITTVLINAAQYFLIHFFRIFALPGYSVEVPTLYFSGDLISANIPFEIFKQAFICFILYLILKQTFSMRDFVKNEK